MTCIVGIQHRGKVYVGGDSLGVAHNYAVRVRDDKKVFTVGNFVIGFTSSYRMGNILQHHLKPPKLPTRRKSLTPYMVREFVPHIQELFVKHKYGTVKDGQQAGGEFIIGIAGELFTIESDFQVAQSSSGYDAVGSGYQVALGSLYSTEKMKNRPRDRIRMALAASEELTGAVRRPFTIKGK